MTDVAGAIPAGYMLGPLAQRLTDEWDKIIPSLDRQSVDAVQTLCRAGRVWVPLRSESEIGPPGIVEVSALGVALLDAILAHRVGQFLSDVENGKFT